MKYITAVILFFFVIHPAMAAPACFNSHPSAATCYVSPFTSNSPGHAGTVGDPFQTWYEFVNSALPGDTLEINCTGTYTVQLYVQSSGSSGNPITYVGNCAIPAGTSLATLGANSSAPLLTGTQSSSHAVQIHYGMHDLVFQNLALSATSANTNAFFLETDPAHSVVTYDLTIDHNTVANNTCGSIELDGGDYYTITHNVVHDNGKTCTTASESGIHTYQPTLENNANVVHILISGNWVYNEGKGTVASDGAGIELDDGNGSQGNHCTNWPTRCPYTAEITIQNNLTNNNDGSGFDSYEETDAPVDIVNNTFYQDTQNQAAGQVWGEMTFNTSNNGQVYNNIIVPKTSAYNCVLSEGTEVKATAINANDCYGATTPYQANGSTQLNIGNANVTGNPNLNNVPTTFTPSPTTTSAAYQTAIGAYAPTPDIYGTSRAASGAGCSAATPPDMGAIQF